MEKREILDIIRSTKPEVKGRYGVERLGLFGSCLRGKRRRKSDIDVLVTFSRDIDLFDFLDSASTLKAACTPRSIWSWNQPSNPPSENASSPRSNMFKGRDGGSEMAYVERLAWPAFLAG